jgi:beta-lactam-binding protein with PASTA domain
MPTTAPPSATTQAAPADPKPTATTDATLVPRFVGMGLQAAQDAAQAKGFYALTSHDSAGRDRMQVLDRNWKVCTQKPASGTKASLDTTLDFGAVKLEETCPATDQAPPAKAGKTMPDFIGKGLNTATAALPSDASITSTDASSQGRMILLESNWKVCTQDPKAGTQLTGQPVAFTAVKFGESCP